VEKYCVATIPGQCSNNTPIVLHHMYRSDPCHRDEVVHCVAAARGCLLGPTLQLQAITCAASQPSMICMDVIGEFPDQLSKCRPSLSLGEGELVPRLSRWGVETMCAPFLHHRMPWSVYLENFLLAPFLQVCAHETLALPAADW
jgi:hypothetical protein